MNKNKNENKSTQIGSTRSLYIIDSQWEKMKKKAESLGVSVSMYINGLILKDLK